MTATTHTPLVNEPMPHPRRWGNAELTRLTEMVKQNSLFYWRGPQTNALYDEFRRHHALRHTFATSSGSAALHVAIAALRLKPGDEVIVPAITDMGTVIGVIYQQLVPVFADIDPHTYNIDPADIRKHITPKTRAIIPVHLAGNPCDMAAIKAIASEHNLRIIEDCAQAWGARWQGKPVGMEGDLACYSFNEFKHVSCGDGGIVATSNLELGTGLSKWGDKYYDRVAGTREPAELAPNYRISEPQAAVAAAQLTKLNDIVANRIRVGNRLNQQLADIPGIQLPKIRKGDTHTYWFYMFRIDPARYDVSRDELVAELVREGVPARGGYLPMPVYQYRVFQNHNFFSGQWPIKDLGLTKMDYRQVSCPAAEQLLRETISLTVNEAMPDAYIDKAISAIRTILGRHT